jgi:anthranilate phosphoribosyltransferase
MKFAIGPRKELGVRTIFNILGPMTNPAGVDRLLIGVYDRKLCRPVAEVLNRLGAAHVMVVHSADGLDEISIAAATHVTEARCGALNEFEFSPEEANVAVSGLAGLEVSSAEESLELIRAAMTGEGGDRAQRARDIIALNAGAALYVAGLARDIPGGVDIAREMLESGAAWQRLEHLASLTQGY